MTNPIDTYRYSVARSENIQAASSNLVYAVGVMTAQPVRSMTIQDAMFRIAEFGRLFPTTTETEIGNV